MDKKCKECRFHSSNTGDPKTPNECRRSIPQILLVPRQQKTLGLHGPEIQMGMVVQAFYPPVAPEQNSCGDFEEKAWGERQP